VKTDRPAVNPAKEPTMKRARPNLFRTKNKQHRTQSRAFSRGFETLEDRHMMAVAPFTIDPTPVFLPAVNSPAASLMAGVNNGTLYIRGTDAADTIKLRQINDAITIDGLTGSFNVSEIQNIVIRSFGGNDTINLKSEAVKGQQAITKPTKIYCGAGDDQVTGGRGNDFILGEDGKDKVWANYGDDIIDGGANDDELHGEAGYDKVFGDLGADKLYGEDNDDYLVGGDGIDYLYGGRGYDRLDGSLGYDYLYGQDDFDYLQDDSALKSDSGSNYLSNTSFVCGWFDRNVLDASLRTEARDDYASNFSITRTEMMSIFDAAKDGYTIDSTEYADLQHLVGNASVVMPDYVRELADKVVNVDPANLYYQEILLGSTGLYAGDTSDHLKTLVDKWFLGLDHPVAQYTINGELHTATYQFVQGSLFQDGIYYTDVNQGKLGDCYYMTALANVALHDPSVIQNMFIDNGDNTFTVRFYRDGVAHYVTVDRFLPTPAAGDQPYSGYPDRVFAWFGSTKDDPANELWVALAEKAYAQLNESGWIGQDSTNSYQGLYAGKIANAMTHVTGWTTYHVSMYTDAKPDPLTGPTLTLSRDQIIEKVNAGKLLGLGSLETPPNSKVVGHHAYTVTGYNPTTGWFGLYNPYGLRRSISSLADHPAFLYLTWDEITANFDHWDFS
jgi:Ca2+-binding RTX toxin-like protein